MRFKWTKPAHDAERAVITMAFARVKCRGLSTEEAVRMTLAHHCQNPEAMPEATFVRLCRRVDKLFDNARLQPQRKEANGR